jgi:hypothetical protein
MHAYLELVWLQVATISFASFLETRVAFSAKFLDKKCAAISGHAKIYPVLLIQHPRSTIASAGILGSTCASWYVLSFHE